MKYLLLSFNSSLLLYLKIDLSTAFVNKIGPVTFNISNVTLPECKIGTGYKKMNNKIAAVEYVKKALQNFTYHGNIAGVALAGQKLQQLESVS